MVVHNFGHAATAEAFQCLGGRMLVPLLRSIERLSYDFAHLAGNARPVSAGGEEEEYAYARRAGLG